jgi:hypothetical protein
MVDRAGSSVDQTRSNGGYSRSFSWSNMIKWLTEQVVKLIKHDQMMDRAGHLVGQTRSNGG